jgi:hypothetical protein
MEPLGRVCNKDHIEACMRIYMKVSMNIKSTVQSGIFPSKFAVKFTSNFAAEVATKGSVQTLFVGYIDVCRSHCIKLCTIFHTKNLC